MYSRRPAGTSASSTGPLRENCSGVPIGRLIAGAARSNTPGPFSNPTTPGSTAAAVARLTRISPPSAALSQATVWVAPEPATSSSR